MHPGCAAPWLRGPGKRRHRAGPPCLICEREMSPLSCAVVVTGDGTGRRPGPRQKLPTPAEKGPGAGPCCHPRVSHASDRVWPTVRPTVRPMPASARQCPSVPVGARQCPSVSACQCPPVPTSAHQSVPTSARRCPSVPASACRCPPVPAEGERGRRSSISLCKAYGSRAQLSGGRGPTLASVSSPLAWQGLGVRTCQTEMTV